jgi:hypothetical protein
MMRVLFDVRGGKFSGVINFSPLVIFIGIYVTRGDFSALSVGSIG